MKQSSGNSSVNPPQEKNANPELTSAAMEFRRDFHQHELKEMMMDWLEAAISKNNTIYDEAKERGRLLFLYKRLDILIDAIYNLLPKAEVTRTKKNIGKGPRSSRT